MVGGAECALGHSPQHVLVTSTLGSYIALDVYDPATRVGGLLHDMLPDSSFDAGVRRAQRGVYADSAIPLLLEPLTARGAAPQPMGAHPVGGARMPFFAPFNIGKRNYEAFLRELSPACLRLEGAAARGEQSRNVRSAIGAGKIRIW